MTSTTGFISALANHLASLPELSLTVGTNLFAESLLDDPAVGEGSVILYDRGSELLPNYYHPQMFWTISISMVGKTRLTVMESVRSIMDTVVGTKFRSESDSNESFKILAVTPVEPGVSLIEKLDSGRFLAEALIQVHVIPT